MNVLQEDLEGVLLMGLQALCKRVVLDTPQSCGGIVLALVPEGQAGEGEVRRAVEMIWASV